MKLYPLTMLDFQDMFPTEDACREYLTLVRWPDGFHCPRCMNTSAWKMGSGLFRCTNCRHRASITSGTIFQDTHKSLQLWFQAAWYIVNQKQGVNALGLQKALGLGSYRTAWSWLHKLRQAMVRPGRDKLSGIVEIDETIIGGPRPGKAGRSAEGKILVLIAVEDKGKEGIGRIRMRTIPNASQVTLKENVQQMVEEGSTVLTDGWKGYDPLKSAGYTHIIVEKTSPSDDSTPLVHRIASLLKRWLLGTHQGAVRASHLNYYLDEFTFRFNRRKSRSRGKLFYCLMQQAVSIDPIPVKTLKVS